MSRIGKLPIAIPSAVKVADLGNNQLNIKGPKGEFSPTIPSILSIALDSSGHSLLFKRKGDGKKEKAMHGLYRSLVNNMILGVSEGFRCVLELVGVGYKVALDKNVLEINVGRSHSTFFVLPPEISAQVEAGGRGKNPSIALTSCDKQLLGQIAFKIKKIRWPEPYKGKGIKFESEVIRRKAGKKAAK